MPAVIPIAAAVVGGVIQNRGTKKATQAQADAADKSNETILTASRESQAFQQKQIDQARADSEPWRVAGGNALMQLAGRIGPGGDLMRSFGMSDFEADPGYAFRQAEGMKGITNSAAARGNLLSGAALKAAGSFNQNLASAEYGNAFSRFKANQEGQYIKLADLSGIGQRVAGQNGQNAMQFGQNVGNNLLRTAGQIGENQIGVGNARASGYLSNANNLTNTVNAAGSAWGQYQRGGF